MGIFRFDASADTAYYRANINYDMQELYYKPPTHTYKNIKHKRGRKRRRR